MKSVLEYLKNASRHMQNIYIVLCIAALLIIRITLSIYTLDSNPSLVEYLSGNLLPEVSGMVIELILILFVVEAIQSSEKKRIDKLKEADSHHKQVMIERRLRAQLRFLLKSIFEDIELPDGSNISQFLFHAIDHEQNQRMINVLKQVLYTEAKTDTFNENLLVSSQLELPLILALSPLCSDLSDRHVKAWMSIAHYLQKINSQSNMEQNAERLLSWIALFDKQTVNEGLVEKI